MPATYRFSKRGGWGGGVSNEHCHAADDSFATTLCRAESMGLLGQVGQAVAKYRGVLEHAAGARAAAVDAEAQLVLLKVCPVGVYACARGCARV